MEKKEVFIEGIREEMKKEYRSLQGKDIIIFGTGSYGQMLLRELTRMGMGKDIVAFCDNNESKWGTFVENVPVDAVDKLIMRYSEAVYIIASSAYQEILKGLEKKRVSIFQKTEYLHLLELQLSFIQNNREKDLVSYAGYWFELYDDLQREGKLDQYKEEVLSYVEDDKSRQIINNRLNFFLSGDVTYLKNIPYDKDMYFSDDYYKMSEYEILFDCGAYDGDSLRRFIEQTQSKYELVCAFEPDEQNYCKMVKLAEENCWQHIEMYQMATGKENGTVSFSNDGSGGAKIVSQGDCKVEVVRLDDFIEKKPTLIKMDIEGAEFDTIKGAENILTTLKPKLAISIYHKWLDFYEIPVYLRKIVPEYKFKIRHHSKCLYDTVLYAYVEQ